MPHCEGKIRYGHEDSATKAVIDLKKKGSTGKLEAYKCRECEFWHVGHGRTIIIELQTHGQPNIEEWRVAFLRFCDTQGITVESCTTIQETE